MAFLTSPREIPVPRILAALLLTLAAAAHAAPPPGIPLWEGAATGMTPAEVLPAFPEAAPAPAAAGRDGRGPEGAAERVRIERVVVAGAPYRARFFFRGPGLERVILERHLEDGLPLSRGLRLAGETRAALAAKYGEPVKRETGGNGYLVEWRAGRTAVRLVVVTRSYQVKLFQVVYEAAPQD